LKDKEASRSPNPLRRMDKNFVREKALFVSRKNYQDFNDSDSINSHMTEKTKKSTNSNKMKKLYDRDIKWRLEKEKKLKKTRD